MKIISAKSISHSYVVSGREIRSLRDVSFDVERGEMLAIIGRNGCGKSTLARHINALIPLQSGELAVNSVNASDKSELMKIRKACAMVFQNPDNQFVSSIVEEDIRFGLKNFGLCADDNAVAEALALVGMSGFEKRSIGTLSGGQKQKIALAGVLAVKPEIVILDEATSMLPPSGRRELAELVMRLHRETDITFIMITQYAEEAVLADRVMLMDNGRVVAIGQARDILTDINLLKASGLKAPFAVELYYDLVERGLPLGECPLTKEGLVELLCRLK